MSAQLPLEGPAASIGERSVNGDSHSNHRLSLLDLPGEVILRVLDRLRPTESVTSYDSTCTRPDVSRDFFQSRTSLTNVVLVSRLFYQLGTPYLYRTIILNSQREVLLLFRTIAKFPDRRPMVRSLAWVAVMPDVTKRQSTMLRQSRADSIPEDCWDSIKNDWPRLPIDFRVAEISKSLTSYLIMHCHSRICRDVYPGWKAPPQYLEVANLVIVGIFDSSTLQTWRLLGAILALCPKIASLFLLHGNRYVPRGPSLTNSPELDALLPLLWDCGKPGGLDDTVIPGPSGHGFLANLQHLTIEAEGQSRAHTYTRYVIFLFLTNSPRLRRVETKGGILHRGIWTLFKQNPKCRLLADNVKELVLLRTQGPRDDMLAMVMAFPKLVSLQAEYDDGSYVVSPRITSSLPFTISSALLRLAETLETLSLTTGPTSYGHWSYIENYPPSLTSLHQMGNLKDLTTESMWLFGRQDVSITLRLPYLLPPTLVNFRLIDYWGTTHNTPHIHHPDNLKYHPEFPNQWNTAEFYCNVLMTLVGENMPPLPDLREVTLVSKQLCEELQAEDSRGDQGQADLTGSPEEPLSKLRASLHAVGIKISVEMPVKSTAAALFDWARIG